MLICLASLYVFDYFNIINQQKGLSPVQYRTKSFV